MKTSLSSPRDESTASVGHKVPPRKCGTRKKEKEHEEDSRDAINGKRELAWIQKMEYFSERETLLSVFGKKLA